MINGYAGWARRCWQMHTRLPKCIYIQYYSVQIKGRRHGMGSLDRFLLIHYHEHVYDSSQSKIIRLDAKVALVEWEVEHKHNSPRNEWNFSNID